MKMNIIQKAVIALTLFEAARLRLGHATARPLSVKNIEATDRDDLLLQYVKILRDAYEEELDSSFPNPVLPVVDVLAGVVRHTTCTGNTTISIFIPLKEEHINNEVVLGYVYEGPDDGKTVVKELLEMTFEYDVQTPVNAAVLFLLVNKIFSTEEIEQYADLFGKLPFLGLLGYWAKRVTGKWVIQYGDWVLLDTKEDEEHFLIQLYPTVDGLGSESGEDFSPWLQGYTQEEVKKMDPRSLFWLGEKQEEIIDNIGDLSTE